MEQKVKNTLEEMYQAIPKGSVFTAGELIFVCSEDWGIGKGGKYRGIRVEEDSSLGAERIVLMNKAQYRESKRKYKYDQMGTAKQVAHSDIREAHGMGTLHFLDTKQTRRLNRQLGLHKINKGNR